MALRGSVLLEAVPNVSLGPQDEAIEPVLGQLRKAQGTGVRLLDVHSDPDHRRTVMTLAGAPAPLMRALLTLTDALLENASLVGHEGVHPRVGLLDVVPVVRLDAARETDAIRCTRVLSDHLDRRDVPSFFYGRIASSSKRRTLAYLRRNLAWEGRPTPLNLPPDKGPPRFHVRMGACCLGVREPLVAYNVLLDTREMEIGRQIASRLRSDTERLPGLQALAFSLASNEDRIQVSMNVTDVDELTLDTVYDAVRELAQQADIPVMGGELVGLAPERTLAEEASSMGLEERPSSLEEHLDAAGYPTKVPAREG